MIPSNLLIINYHKIEQKSDIGITARHPEAFKRDMDTLVQAGYTTINFHHLNAQKKLPVKPVIITFDDAYLSFYQVAFEELLKRSMTGVVYVPVNYIGKSNDWDVQLGHKKYSHMTTQQLREITAQKFEIGSHTLNHKYLNNLSEPELENELGESKRILEEQTGASVISVSYPFGKYNKNVLNLSQKYYDFGVQLMPSFFRDSPDNKLCLRRINIYRTDSAATFEKKLSYSNYKLLIIKNRLIQQGAWATIFLKKIRGNK
jgi:peptidoglycan/xylan/chitin deacetylase (PgdA/CDA1 family)